MRPRARRAWWRLGSLLACASATACGLIIGLDDYEHAPAEAGDAADGQPTSEAAADGSGPPLDASPGDADAAPCDLAAPWDPPMEVKALNGMPPNPFSLFPYLSLDERTVYFTSQRQGDAVAKVYVAQRDSIDTLFGNATAVAFMGDDGGVRRFHPTLTPDQLTMIVDSNARLFAASRLSVDAAFETPSPTMVQSLSPVSEFHPFFTADATEIYYSSNAESVTDDLYHARVKNLAALTFFSSSKVLPPDSGVGYNRNPVVTADGLSVYFSRIDLGEFCGGEIWLATRSKTSASFGAPRLVTELMSPGGGSRPGWISPDGCRMYISICSLDDAGSTSERIFLTTKPPPRDR